MTERHSEAETPAGPQAEGFDYARHFGTMRTIGEIVRTPGPRAWTTTMPRDAEHHRFVVWLGCNIVRTAHIAEALGDVLRHLGVDFVALGGPSHCCGIVHRTHGDHPVADAMLQQTMRKFDRFKPERLLNWCPSCDGTLREAPPAALTETARQRQSVTAFLASIHTRFDLRPIPPVKLALHAHTGDPDQDEDAAAARRLLALVPGVELVATRPVTEYGRHCSDANVNTNGQAAYLASVRAWADEARQGGAGQIVSIYHSCHRQLLLAQRGLPPQARMPVTNYLTILARSLGLPERADTFSSLAAHAGVEAVIAEVSPGLAAAGIDPARARTALQDQFG